MAGTWYRLVRSISRGVFALLGGLQSVDEHRVPREGPTIFAPMHVSFLDPPALACGTERTMRFMAKESLFRVPILGALIRSLGAFPVRRGESDTESIRRTLALLEAGEAVLIFPEGTRGDGLELQPINRGVAMLAKRTGAQVVPVAVLGTQYVLPRKGRGRRHRMILVFGPPFRYDQFSGASDRDTRDAFTAHLSAELVRLAQGAGSPIRHSEGPRTLPEASI
jgi:1-acyl-sn-glycerol-3-phosphate acyltransferase